MKKSVIVLWGVAVLFLFGSFSLFAQSDIGTGVFGVALAAACGGIGFYLHKKPKSESARPSGKVPVSVPAPASTEPFEIRSFKLAGVSFKNDDGSSRQTVLRKLKFNDPPFEHEADLSLSRYEYEGKPAFAVEANGIQIGNIPAKDVEFILENWDRIENFTGCHVYGGGKADDGEQKSFGCEVSLRFRKKEAIV